MVSPLAASLSGGTAKLALLGDGYAIEWVDVDEHIGVEGLLAGRQSGESYHSFERWLATRNTSSELERANNSNAVDG